jgi:hypothetical protein
VLTTSSPALHNPDGFPGMATYKRKIFTNCTPDDGHIGAPKHVEAIKPAYFVASGWFFTFTVPLLLPTGTLQPALNTANRH